MFREFLGTRKCEFRSIFLIICYALNFIMLVKIIKDISSVLFFAIGNRREPWIFTLRIFGVNICDDSFDYPVRVHTRDL